jgi:TIR domain
MMARIFLCHASEDKVQVRAVYHRLRAIAGFEPWLDEEDLLPGQDWTREIPRALQTSDFILVFFSRLSVAKHGYVQREMKLALDALQELPEGTIHTIPVRLDDCELPASFQHYHYANLFDSTGFDHIVRAIRAEIAPRSGPTPPPSPQPSPRPIDAVPRREEAATLPVREKDRPEVHPYPTGDAREIPGRSRRPKRRLVLVGGVLLCVLVTALYLVLSGQRPSSLPPELGAPSALLVGTWRFTGVELGQPRDIRWHLRPDGTETYIVNGVSQGTGTWQYIGAHIYEWYPNGRQGKGAIQILDRDRFRVTILDNGVPDEKGLQRLYIRQ